LGVAVVLTDRFARARRRGLPEMLDATGAGPALRLVGALLGSLAVALLPVTGAMLAVGVTFAISRGDPTALAWAVLALAVIIVPAALVAATFAATLGLILPVPLARFAVLGAWIWATVWNSAIIPLPSASATVLSPLGDYAAHGWLHAPAVNAATPSLLSPAITATSAGVSLAALLMVTACLLVTARVLRNARG
jgi:ABC-2 type transport system permease protein